MFRLGNSLNRKSFKTSAIATSLFALTFLGTANSAMAHHAMGGGLPANWWQGFLSGLAHPIIGIDHFAFVIAMGLVASRLPKGVLLPIPFLAAAVAGTSIHLMKLDLPVAEIIVSSSVILFGALLLFEQKLNFATLAAIAALVGLFHGYAYGESIVGAEATPIAAYLIGFTLVQWGIASLARWGAKTVIPKVNLQPLKVMRGLGVTICLIGAYFLKNAIAG